MATPLLYEGQYMYPGGGFVLVSPNQHFVAQFNPDSNFVVYAQDDVSDPFPAWSSGTAGRNADFLVLQHDGNLVMYGRDRSVITNTRTDGNPGAWLQMQDDGNLVLYRADSAPLWQSGSSVAAFMASIRLLDHASRADVAQSHGLAGGVSTARLAVAVAFMARAALREALRRILTRDPPQDDPSQKHRRDETERYLDRLERYDRGEREPGEKPRRLDERHDPF